jgi:hypothetical protein
VNQDADERTLNDLIVVLGADVDRCYDNVRDTVEAYRADPESAMGFEFEARQLIRAIFAYLEGLTFAIKVRAVEESIRKNELVSQAEHDFALEVDHLLNERGEIVERAALINLSRNIRFAFQLYEKVFDHKPRFDAHARWWDCLQRSIKVRDRLTHPRVPEDLDVTANEVIQALEPRQGFRDLLQAYIVDEKARTSKPSE